MALRVNADEWRPVVVHLCLRQIASDGHGKNHLDKGVFINQKLAALFRIPELAKISIDCELLLKLIAGT